MSAENIRGILQECMDRAVAEEEVAGCTFCLIRDGREQLYLESGYADKESGRKISRDSIYRMYSMSKPVTAAAAMKLVEDGRLDLLEPVGTYLESFRHQRYETRDGRVAFVPEDHPMLVRDLLNMTSGLVYPDPSSMAGRETDVVMQDVIDHLGSEQAVSTAEFASRIGECTLLFAPGEAFRYGVSADILGAVIEAVSGETFGEFEKENILDPVGMTDTAFYVPEEKKDRLVTVYRHQNDDRSRPLVPYTGNHLGIRNNGGFNPFESGGAGLFSTLDDYRKFTGMLMNGGKAENGRQVLRPGTVRFMTSGRLNAAQQIWMDKDWGGLVGHSYANLNRVMVDPSQAATIGHKGEYGWDGWLGVYYDNDPEIHQTMLLMLQQKDYGTGRFTRQIRNIVNSDTQ